MNGYDNTFMREIQSDERLYLIFNAFAEATEIEKSKYTFVRYTNTGRLDILYDNKPVSLEEAAKKAHHILA